MHHDGISETKYSSILSFWMFADSKSGATRKPKDRIAFGLLRKAV